jgi:hypothetical protein
MPPGEVTRHCYQGTVCHGPTVAQRRELARLREDGVTSEDELQAKKTLLLERIAYGLALVPLVKHHVSMRSR